MRYRARLVAHQIDHRDSDLYDPFAVDPIRRSLVAVVASAALLLGPPALLGEQAAAVVMVCGGWLAAAVFALSLPVLAMSLAEAGWRALARRLHPSVDELQLSPRVRHLLRRHGFETIASVDRAPDAALLVLSNFDERALREVRRAINLWKYRRWQEAGFPSAGD